MAGENYEPKKDLKGLGIEEFNKRRAMFNQGQTSSSSALTSSSTPPLVARNSSMAGSNDTNKKNILSDDKIATKEEVVGELKIDSSIDDDFIRLITCSVTGSIFHTPVTLMPSNKRVEQCVVEKLKGKCPITNIPIENTKVDSDFRDLIMLYLDKHPELKAKQHDPVKFAAEYAKSASQLGEEVPELLEQQLSFYRFVANFFRSSTSDSASEHAALTGTSAFQSEEGEDEATAAEQEPEERVRLVEEQEAFVQEDSDEEDAAAWQATEEPSEIAFLPIARAFNAVAIEKEVWKKLETNVDGQQDAKEEVVEHIADEIRQRMLSSGSDVEKDEIITNPIPKDIFDYFHERTLPRWVTGRDPDINADDLIAAFASVLKDYSSEVLSTESTNANVSDRISDTPVGSYLIGKKACTPDTSSRHLTEPLALHSDEEKEKLSSPLSPEEQGILNELPAIPDVTSDASSISTIPRAISIPTRNLYHLSPSSPLISRTNNEQKITEEKEDFSLPILVVIESEPQKGISYGLTVISDNIDFFKNIPLYSREYLINGIPPCHVYSSVGWKQRADLWLYFGEQVVIPTTPIVQSGIVSSTTRPSGALKTAVLSGDIIKNFRKPVVYGVFYDVANLQVELVQNGLGVIRKPGVKCNNAAESKELGGKLFDKLGEVIFEMHKPATAKQDVKPKCLVM